MGSVLVLVDSYNLHVDCKDAGKKLDYKKLAELAAESFPGSKLHLNAYVSVDKESDSSRFEILLRSLGYNAYMKRFSKRGSSKEARQEVTIAMDAATLLNQVEGLVLVSGDGAYAELLARYRAAGK